MTGAVAWLDQVPAAVQAVFEDFRTAELATIGRDGTPLAWPIVSAFRSETGHFLTTTSIGFPDKALRIRRNPKVSLLFSDPTGSGLDSPPAVHVVGDAECPDTIRTEVTGFEADVRRMYGYQPKARFYGVDPLAKIARLVLHASCDRNQTPPDQVVATRRLCPGSDGGPL